MIIGKFSSIYLILQKIKPCKRSLTNSTILVCIQISHDVMGCGLARLSFSDVDIIVSSVVGIFS